MKDDRDPQQLYEADQAREAARMKGRRVRLLHCADPYTSLAPGELGTVRLVDDLGTVHVHWDNGSRLGLVPGEDSWELV